MDDSGEDTQEFIIKNKRPKQQIITFAKINKYFLIPFLCPIFCMLANYLLIYIDESHVIKKAEFVIPFYVMFSYIGAGAIYFISYFKQKVESGKEHIIYRESNSIRYIYNDSNKKIFALKEYILIIFLGFLSSLFELLSVFCSQKNVFEERLYFLLFIPLFSKLILKDNIFRHQYFSLLIAIIGIIMLCIPVGIAFTKDDIVANILTFINGVSYSLFLVIIKYMTHIFYISPFKLSLIFGIISLVFIFLGFFFYSLFRYQDLSYFKACVDFTEIENKFLVSLYFILTFIFATALQFFTLLVIFYFSPILLMVTDIISPMVLWIVLAIQKRVGIDTPEVILKPIGYVIVLFASLVYNEIIIFNFCDLGKDTKKFVEERLSLESKDLRRTENDLKLGGLARSEDGTNDDGTEEDRFSHSS